MLVKTIPGLQKCVNCLVSAPKMIGGTRRQTDLRIVPRTSKPCDDPIFIAPSWFSAPPGLTLPTGAGPIYRRNELLCRIGDIERNLGPKRGRNVLQDALPSSAQHYDVAVSEFGRSCSAAAHFFWDALNLVGWSLQRSPKHFQPRTQYNILALYSWLSKVNADHLHALAELAPLLQTR